MDLNPREIALLHQCLEHSLTHIEEIEDITDEHIKDELEALKARMEAAGQDDHEKGALRKRLAEVFEEILNRFGDSPQVRLAVANFTLGYMGTSYGLHIPQ